MTGWALTIAGIPKVFTTHPMGTITSASSLWWGGETGVTYADGWLVPPTATLSERARPLEGELDVSPLTFTLHDATADGSPLLTWLAARDSISVTSTPLPSTITAAATSITVGDGSLFTANTFAWLNREALRVTAVAGNVLTVTRARLGTKAVAHIADAGAGLYPEVFTAVPWTLRRKVSLWRVDGTTAVLVWQGTASRSPSLDADGARFSLSCEPLWSTLRSNPVGGELGSTRLVGYSDGRSRGNISSPPLLRTGWSFAAGPIARATSNGSYRDIHSLIADHVARVSTATAAVSSRVELHISQSGSTTLTFDADHTAAFTLNATWTTRAVSAASIARTGSRQSVAVEITDVPRALVMLFPHDLGGVYPISSLGSLPTTWSPTTTTLGSITTTEQPALRLIVSDDWYVCFVKIAGTDFTADGGELGPRIAAGQTWHRRKPGPALDASVRVVANPAPLQAVYRVRTDHWVHGLRYSVVALCEDGVTDDWYWTNQSTIVSSTAGLRVSRDWLFDGKRTLGSVVTECCLLHGCSPVVRSGRLALHAWGWPSAGATPAAAFTTASIIGVPHWERWQDGLANRVTIKSDTLTLTATQAHSRARFGPGRSVAIELAGADEQSFPVDDPIAFGRDVVGRLELWSEPLSVVTFTVSAEHWDTCELGSLVTLTEWMLPDGAGSRGMDGARAIVIGRTLDFTRATVSLECVVFPRAAYPYAPCAKAASVVSATVLQLATGYVGGTTSYSGGNDATTFTAGDLVELVERDTTTAWSEALTIASVNAGLGRITFTTSMSATAQTKIGAGWVDLRFATFSTCGTTQRSSWMFTGDDATSVIDGTAETVRAIAP